MDPHGSCGCGISRSRAIPPKGYRIGSEYTQEQINRALEANTMAEREALVPSIDTSGHGRLYWGSQREMEEKVRERSVA